MFSLGLSLTHSLFSLSRLLVCSFTQFPSLFHFLGISLSLHSYSKAIDLEDEKNSNAIAKSADVEVAEFITGSHAHTNEHSHRLRIHRANTSQIWHKLTTLFTHTHTHTHTLSHRSRRPTQQEKSSSQHARSISRSTRWSVWSILSWFLTASSAAFAWRVRPLLMCTART